MAMVNLILAFFLFLNVSLGSESNEAIVTKVKVIRSGELENLFELITNKDDVETVLSDDSSLSKANGYGNPGDLIYRYRESNDVLQIREVIVLPEISSDVQEIQWYAVTRARRITSVRVLNFGTERAYTLRIDVAGNEVQTILRIPSNYDPRIMIEVYGF